MPHYVLTLSCPDRTGIVAAVAGFIAQRQGLITEAAHFVEPLSNRSFMRMKFKIESEYDVVSAQFADVAARFDMQWALHDAQHRCRVLIAVSRQDHCLNSLLHRWSIGALPIEIVAVVSNHDANRRLAGWYDVPFRCFPVDAGGKAAQEAQLLQLFATSGAELLVLARYMQILSEHACRQLAGRCINIHHSFLPGFKGARPYHQACERGVKIVGATAHYVTADLDEGPIIEQDVQRVDHTMQPEDLIELGHDLEASVLNRAVRWHADHRVFMTGNRTVVLRS